MAASGRRTAGRAPFDDPDFVPPSFQNGAFGQAGLGGASAGAGGFGGATAGAGSRGSAGGTGPQPFSPTATGPQSFGTTAAGLPVRGSASADLPVHGSASADMFGSAAGGAFPASAFPGVAFPGGDAADAGLTDGPAFGRPAAADPAAPPMRTLGSAQRLNAVRTPRTKGHPPWEPAEKPRTELPWMDAPARGGAPGRVVPPRPYPGADGGPAPDQPGESAPYPAENGRGLGRRGPIDRGPFPELDPPPGIDSDGPAAQRPRYSWNPADTTEAFPAVGPDDTPLA